MIDLIEIEGNHNQSCEKEKMRKGRSDRITVDCWD